jgi:rSAM/selenodomain-associated transferase 2
MQKPPLTIVIPTYNAMPRLAECLAALVEGLIAGLVREVIVVDGASTDASAALAADMGCKVIIVEAHERGRGAQLGRGALTAQGDWLMFLHGDTVLQAGWSSVVLAHVLGAQSEKAGYFTLAFGDGGAKGKRVAGLANWRAHTFGLPYGDAGLVMARDHYERVGGYQALALMEDVDIVRRIGRAGLVALAATAQTSPDKYVRAGWWRVPLRNLMLLCAFLLGVNPTRLTQWYK